jgi:MFS family permease
MSGLLTGRAFTAQFPEMDTTATGNGSASLQGTVVAIYEIGCFFGAIIALLIGEKIGRRKTIMLGCIVLSIGGALQACAYGIPHLIVGRIVAGLGNGLNTSTIRESCSGRIPRPYIETDHHAAVWHSELMQADVRGKGVSQLVANPQCRQF